MQLIFITFIYLHYSGKGPSCLFHFGMTGAFIIKDLDHATYRSSSTYQADQAWPPKFTKLEIIFDTDHGDMHVAFTDPRRRGRIRLCDGDPTIYPPISKYVLHVLFIRIILM